MATAMKKCKVCGCEYEYCHTVKRIAGVFRWQDVTCSPEHGSIYLARIEASRTNQVTDNDIKIVDEAENKPAHIEDNDVDDKSDSLFEEDPEDILEEISIGK